MRDDDVLPIVDLRPGTHCRELAAHRISLAQTKMAPGCQRRTRKTSSQLYSISCVQNVYFGIDSSSIRDISISFTVLSQLELHNTSHEQSRGIIVLG
jgi:hypothetical protein